jgi:hypothetical protein
VDLTWEGISREMMEPGVYVFLIKIYNKITTESRLIKTINNTA